MHFARLTLAIGTQNVYRLFYQHLTEIVSSAQVEELLRAHDHVALLVR